MSKRVNISLTPNGLHYQKPPAGERGQVKKSSPFGILVAGSRFNRTSLIKFINSRMEPTEPKLKKGCFGTSNKNIRAALYAVLKEKVVLPPEDPVVNPLKPEDKRFFEKITPLQLVLYQSLKSGAEKQLYEQLYSLGNTQFPGIFADLLVSLIKDRVVRFQIQGNDINIDLIKGVQPRRLLNNPLKAHYPARLTLRFDPAMQKLSFINSKIPFTYSFLDLDILTPESATLTPQGIHIQANLGKAAIASGQGKHLDKPLNNNQIFKLFE